MPSMRHLNFLEVCVSQPMAPGEAVQYALGVGVVWGGGGGGGAGIAEGPDYDMWVCPMSVSALQ